MKLEIQVTDDQLKIIAEHIAAIIPTPPLPNSWLDVTNAAEHLACPKSRIYALVSARRIPFHHDGSRLLFDRRELDGWVRGGGAKRP